MKTKLKVSNFGSRMEISPGTIAARILLEKAMDDENMVIYSLTMSGHISCEENEIYDLFEKAGGRKFHESLYSNNLPDIIYVWDHGMVDVHTNKSNSSFSMSGYSSNKEFLVSIRDELEKRQTAVTKTGYVFAIMRSSNGNLGLTRIGYAGSKLERRNYTKEVIDDYDFVIKDLMTPSPSGRIVILEGDPGTGKTFLVRSILMDVEDAMFVIVPPGMVSSLGGPDLLPILLQTKEAYQKKGPVILILEDADQCLVPRQGDNMSSISSILNLGDGIFGSLFDIRIIATTNARKAQMDPAIIRAGRLSRRIEVLPMNYDQASNIFQRLLPGKQLPELEVDDTPRMRPSQDKSKFTLAEVYKAARDMGWEPEDNLAKSELHEGINAYADDEDNSDPEE